MIGMGTIITKKIKIFPGYVYYGKPIKKIKKNLIGIKRNNVSNKMLKNEKKRFLDLFNEKK